MPKVWMNQTTSSNWQGNQVGISRVEHELFKNLNFIGFIRTHNGFVAYSSSNKLKNILGEKIVSPKTLKTNKANAFVTSKLILSRRIRIARATGYFLSAFFDFSRFSDYVLQRVIFLSYETLRRLTPAGRILRRSRLRQRESRNSIIERKTFIHPFEDGDLIFTCGLDWDYRVLENLSLVKKEKDVQIVSVVFDLIPIFNPELIQNSRHVSSLLGHFSSVIESSDLILVNSKSTQKQLADLSQELGLILPNTRIVPWGVTPPELNLDNEINKPSSIGNDVEFVLAVGTLEIRKNYELLVQVVKLSKEEKIEIPLMVFAGRPGWGTHDLMQRIRNDESIREKLIWLENVTDRQLDWLYSNCNALLSPTFSEGFGLPVAESQAFQKKVV
jgi:glycosyltransferase involved in cell wall biosynthesis